MKMVSKALFDTTADLLHKALPILWAERDRRHKEAWMVGHYDRAMDHFCEDVECVLSEIKHQRAKEEEMEKAQNAVHISDEEKQRRFDQAMRDDIDNRFTYHPPKGEQAERYVYLREQFRYVAQEVLRQCPPSRDRSLALTKLQEAMMWANASIAINE